jgi:hypothetical protein
LLKIARAFDNQPERVTSHVQVPRPSPPKRPKPINPELSPLVLEAILKTIVASVTKTNHIIQKSAR